MRVHSLEHVWFEDLAHIADWAKGKKFPVTKTRLFQGEALPSINDFDLLVVMGGPMNIYEEREYPWLIQEKKFIEKAISAGKSVLGICLGAQLISDVLGGRVYQNREKEIGWFPVKLTKEAQKSPYFKVLPGEFSAFHWHGDTFHLAPGCKRMAESEGCANQAFEFDGRVIGLQYHLESTEESIRRLVDQCRSDFTQGPHVQNPEDILLMLKKVGEIKRLLDAFLDRIENSMRFVSGTQT